MIITKLKVIAPILIYLFLSESGYANGKQKKPVNQKKVYKKELVKKPIPPLHLLPALPAVPVPVQVPVHSDSVEIKAIDMATQNTHEKEVLKAYEDSKKNLFWPMGLPFWIRLAASPEDGGQSFLLKKQEINGGKDNKEEDIKEGMRLEIPGSQFIRWINYVSKDEHMLRFFSDGTPPHVKILLQKAPSYHSQSSYFFGKNLMAAVAAIDDQSGVNKIYLAIDDKPFGIFDGKAILFNEEHIYHLHYYAVDNVGYVSPMMSSTFQVDLTTPQSTIHNETNFKDNVLSKDTIIRLQSKDALSGIKEIFYKIDSEPNYAIYNANQGIKLSSATDGSHVLSYYAVDNVANRESPQKYLFYLDHMAPSVAHTFIGDHHFAQSKDFVSNRTRLKLDAHDSQVGVKSIVYKTNAEESHPYMGPFMPPVKSGEFSISYAVTDELGNASDLIQVKLVMDNDPPKTNYEVKGHTFLKDKGVLYLNGSANIVLTSKDDLSGVKSISFQINELQPEIYNAPITLSRDGRYLFRYWSIDHVENQEAISTVLFIVDNKPPEIVTIFSQDSLVKSVTHGPQSQAVIQDIYPTNTALTLNSIDDASGVMLIRYSLGDSEEKDYTGPINFTKPGIYHLNLIAVDKVGNKTKRELSLKITDHI